LRFPTYHRPLKATERGHSVISVPIAIQQASIATATPQRPRPEISELKIMERGIMKAGHLSLFQFSSVSAQSASKPLLLPPHGWPQFRNIIIEHHRKHHVPKDNPQYPFTHLRFGLILFPCLMSYGKPQKVLRQTSRHV
jgi:hypothetical protein